MLAVGIAIMQWNTTCLYNSGRSMAMHLHLSNRDQSAFCQVRMRLGNCVYAEIAGNFTLALGKMSIITFAVHTCGWLCVLCMVMVRYSVK